MRQDLFEARPDKRRIVQQPSTGSGKLISQEQQLTKIYLDNKQLPGQQQALQQSSKKVPKAYLQKVLSDTRSKSTRLGEANVINSSFTHFKR